MKKKTTYFLIFIVCMLVFLSNNKVYAMDIQTSEYSKKYQEWLELSEEEKNGKIAPLPFNIRNKKETTIKSKVRSILKASQIPSKFDLRDKIQIEVKNQESTGACWAFAANASLETYLALQGENYDFSERHMEYETSKSFIDEENPNALNREVGEGGTGITSFTYYSRGSGPILEEDMPFENNENKIKLEELPTNVTIKKVDNMVFFPNIFKEKNSNGELIYKDANDVPYTEAEILEIRNKVKEHIMNYGGVSAAVNGASPYADHFNSNTNADNITDSSVLADHAATIIGWDDNYSKENFVNKPTQDGAYIVLNSWGEEYGDNGVYYVSYEDMLIENEMKGVTSVSDVQYDEIYQYDMSEMYAIIKSQYAANIFSVKDNEILKEIVVGSWSEQICDIYINTTNGDLKEENLTKIASNVNLRPGYNTIKLDNDISLSKDNKFSVVVKLTSSGYEGIGVECNVEGYLGKAISHEGESFVSNDGVTWNDIYDANNMMNLSIKAYTQKKEESLSVEDIKGKIYEDVGGTCRITLSTSYLENNKEVGIKIYKGDTEITNEFKIVNNKIKGKGAFITVQCPNNMKQGVYDIHVNLEGFDTVIKQFFVLQSTTNIVAIPFQDENFYSCMKSQIGSGICNDTELKISTFEEEVTKIRELVNVNNKNISDISGIEYFTNLEKVNLNDNKISNITPLQNLGKLEEVLLDGNQLKSMEVIGSLTNLKVLDLGHNELEIEQVEELKNLSKLEELSLDYIKTEKVIDISAIFELENLQKLDLTGNLWITQDNLRDIYKLDKLKKLELSACSNITDLTPISRMTNLTELNMNDCKVETLAPLENIIENLASLYFEKGTVRDASVVDKKKSDYDNLSASENVICDEIEEGGIIEKEIPQIIKQAMNAESVLYSPDGVSLDGCEWSELGEKIKVDTTNKEGASITVNSGKANKTQYRIKILSESDKIRKGDINQDGKIDTTDLLKLLRHIAASKSNETAQKYPIWILVERNLQAADINDDEKVDATDLLKILRHMAAYKNEETAKKYPEWIIQ